MLSLYWPALILACSAVALAAGVYVLLPLFTEPRGNLEAELLAETELDRLLNRKAVVYTNLKDLEFEFRMGRLGEQDRQRLEAGYKAEAETILRKLDRLGVEKDIDDSIEKDISARRARLYPADRAPVTLCPGCGSELIPGKRHCAECGRSV